MHYSSEVKYDSLDRFISYYYQIKLARELNPQKILEIGVGNKTVSNYLKANGYDVKTCDYDGAVGADITADIRKLPLEADSFDTVLAYEIIEHIPWEDVSVALKELHRVAKKYVILSTPYSSGSIEIIFASQIFTKLFKKTLIDIFLRIPKFWHKHKFSGIEGSHLWEMGRKGFSISNFRKKLREHFKIIDEVRPYLSADLNHYFFVLEKK